MSSVRARAIHDTFYKWNKNAPSTLLSFISTHEITQQCTRRVSYFFNCERLWRQQTNGSKLSISFLNWLQSSPPVWRRVLILSRQFFPSPRRILVLKSNKDFTRAGKNFWVTTLLFPNAIWIMARKWKLNLLI